MQRQMGGACTQQGLFGSNHVVHRFHLGHHDVTQALTGRAGNDVDIACKSGVVCGVHTRCHPGSGRGTRCQRSHQAGMLHLLPHRCTVFAIQRHIHHASAKLFGQLSLHLQALAHASFHTAVVIAHRQCLYTRLGAEQYFTGVECVHHQLQGYVQCPGGEKSCGHCKSKARATACLSPLSN